MKQRLLNQVIQIIESDLQSIRKVAEETHKSSTSEESKQEGKYDTRGLEASYLAGAQAEQCKLLEEGLHKLQNLPLTEEDDSVTPGSIVILSGDDEDHQYFLLPAGGGIELEYEDEPLMVITPESPIGSLVIGKFIADSIESEQLGSAFISEIY